MSHIDVHIQSLEPVFDDVSTRCDAWLMDHSLVVLHRDTIRQYLELDGTRYDYDELGFPSFSSHRLGDRIVMKIQDRRHYGGPYGYWYRFPDGRRELAMLFKLTWGGR